MKKLILISLFTLSTFAQGSFGTYPLYDSGNLDYRMDVLTGILQEAIGPNLEVDIVRNSINPLWNHVKFINFVQNGNRGYCELLELYQGLRTIRSCHWGTRDIPTGSIPFEREVEFLDIINYETFSIDRFAQTLEHNTSNIIAITMEHTRTPNRYRVNYWHQFDENNDLNYSCNIVFNQGHHNFADFNCWLRSNVRGVTPPRDFRGTITKSSHLIE